MFSPAGQGLHAASPSLAAVAVPKDRRFRNLVRKESARRPSIPEARRNVLGTRVGRGIAQRSVFKDERDRHDHVSHGVSQTIRAEVEHRADAAAFYESTRRMPWLLEIGRTLRAELDAVEQPVSERLAAMLKELERPTAT